MRNQRPGVASQGRPGFSLDPVVVCPGNLGSSLAFSWVSFSHLYSWMCLWWGTLECIFGPFLWFPARHGSCWAVVGCVPPTLLSSVPGPVPVPPELAPRALWLPSQPGQDSGGWQLGGGRAESRKLGRESLLEMAEVGQLPQGQGEPWLPHFHFCCSRFPAVLGDGSELLPLAQGGARQPRTAGEREGGASPQLERVLRSSLMPLWLRGLGQCLHLPEPSFPASASHKCCLASIALCARPQWKWALLVHHLI